jgi:hypothetical protein
MHQLFIQFINYVWYLPHVSALHCHPQGVFLLRDAELRSDLRSPRTTSLDTTRPPIHNILSTAPQLIIYQKALGTLREDGNVMPKHVGDTIHN